MKRQQIEESSFYKLWHSITAKDLIRFTNGKVLDFVIFDYDFIRGGLLKSSRYEKDVPSREFDHFGIMVNGELRRYSIKDDFPSFMYDMPNNFFKKFRNLDDNKKVMKLFLKYKKIYFSDDFFSEYWYNITSVYDNMFMQSSIEKTQKEISRKTALLLEKEKELHILEKNVLSLKYEIKKEEKKLKIQQKLS